jgi:hypothetical protein
VKELVAYCGIVCTACPTYQATRNNDNKAKARIAEDWSKQYQHSFKAEDINCAGCLANGKRQIGYCSVCEIRKCGVNKKVLNCGCCAEYPCEKLSNFLTRAPRAKEKLEAVRAMVDQPS